MKVKDLVWQSDLDFPTPTADTPIGSYELLALSDGHSVTLVFDNTPLTDHDSLELGKLAASKHFERTVTSCLEP